MDSDEELEKSDSWKGVPATIICINTYDRRGKTAEVAHAATCRMIRQCLRLSGSDLIGVCLYGTEVTNTSILGINSVEEVFPLKLPTLDDYRKLKSLEIASLKQQQDLILSEVLWYCSRSFSSCKRQISSRNIIVLSRLDVPPLQSDQKPALKRVVELADSYINVRLINICEDDYEVNSFYNNFLIEVSKKEDIVVPKPVWDQKEIEQLLHQQSHRHLAVARLSFEIGEGVAIGVGVYSLLKGSSPTIKHITLHRDTNEILTSINKTNKITVRDEDSMDVDEDQEARSVPLLKSELLFYKTIGGEKIHFTDVEMKTLRNPFGPPKLKLLGFKPARMMCKEKWFLKPCYFLFPSEGIVEGSTIAFKALYKACVETNVVALCVFCPRVNARPSIVALSPSSKPFNLDVEIGFDIIRVPFIENVRQIPSVDEEDDELPQANKTLMKNILKDLQFQYKADMFENPKVQAQYKALEAIALDEDDDDKDEPFIDTTKPNSDRFQDLPDDQFQDLFGPFGTIAVKKPAGSSGGPAPKKPRGGCDEVLLQERLVYKTVKDYTVPELRDILYSKNLPGLPALNGLKKKDLVELVYKFFK